MAKLQTFGTRRRLPKGGSAAFIKAGKGVVVTNPKAGPVATAKRTPTLGMGGFQRTSH